MNRIFVRYSKNQSHSISYTKTQKKYLFFSLLALVLLLFFFLLLKLSIWSNDKYVESIIYSPESTSVVQDKVMYDFFTSKLFSKNIYNVSFLSNSSLLKSIKKEYYFVEDIVVDSFEDWQLLTTVLFTEPDLIIRWSDKKWWLYNDWYTYEIQSWDNLWKNINRIYLPEYLTWIWSLSGIFFETSANELYDAYNLVNNEFGTWRIEYLLGSEELLLRIDWKDIYFNLNVDINKQLERHRILKKFYTEYDKIYEIDLWNLEQLIIKQKI